MALKENPYTFKVPLLLMNEVNQSRLVPHQCLLLLVRYNGRYFGISVEGSVTQRVCFHTFLFVKLIWRCAGSYAGSGIIFQSSVPRYYAAMVCRIRRSGRGRMRAAHAGVLISLDKQDGEIKSKSST